MALPAPGTPREEKESTPSYGKREKQYSPMPRNEKKRACTQPVFSIVHSAEHLL